MNRADTLRQVDTAPDPGSPWTALAQGVRRMTGEAKQEAVDAARLIFTSKTTWAAIVAAILLGMWVQAQISTVEAVSTRQAEILSSVQGVQATLEVMADSSRDATQEREALRVRLTTLENEVKRQEREYRLLEDAVEGRIGKLPYRPQTGDTP
jgi:hypothetical protein